MELTRSDVVFSRIALVLFLCRNESSQNVLKIYEEYFSKYEKYLRKDPPEGMGQWATSRVDATPRWRLARLWGPRGSAAPNLSSINSVSSQKNKKRRFRRACDTEVPPHPVLHLECRSGVRSGLRKGEIVAFVIINLPPSPIS